MRIAHAITLSLDLHTLMKYDCSRVQPLDSSCCQGAHARVRRSVEGDGAHFMTDHNVVCSRRKSAEGKVCYVSVQMSETGPLFAKDIPVNKGEILTLATRQ